MKTILEEQRHHLPEAEPVDFLETAAGRGVDDFEVRHRQEQFGPNTITQKKGAARSSCFCCSCFSPT